MNQLSLDVSKGLTQKQRVLQALRAAGHVGVTNWEFVEDMHIHRFGANLHQLKKDGYDIRTRQIKRGYFKYILMEEYNG